MNSPRRGAAASRQSAGFTLIELLVVIAIIAILAAILFPVFARAREQARKTACLSNMKQMGIALMMYSQDFDETLPTRFGGSCPVPPLATSDCVGNPPRQRIWKDMLDAYIKSFNVFKCPSNTTAEVPDNKGYWPAGYCMYLPNGSFNVMDAGRAYPQPLAGLRQPSYDLIIFETSYLTGDGGPYQVYSEPSVPAVNSEAAAPSSWSSGHSQRRGNMIFMDGHAKWTSLKDTYNEYGGWNMWTTSQAAMTAAGSQTYNILLNGLNSYPDKD